jgi:RsmE family RNA methyltransferase|nr:RsmE family RNA methyltransferase [Kofleriaceae bacterium]
MNLLLVDTGELAGDGTCVVRDRRASHLRGVLGVAVGDHVRAGVVGGAAGRARVLAVRDPDNEVELAFELGATAMPALPVDLVLAVPRPKALARVIEIAASFAVRRVDLTNSWRVDKSYLRSPRLAPEVLAHHARLGAEQGATTHVPAVDVHARLMPLLDARWPAGAATPARALLIAHPDAPPLESVASLADVTLAIGPEGGWIQRELDTVVARGFTPISLGDPILRVEAAVAAALGQIILLRRLRAGSPR